MNARSWGASGLRRVTTIYRKVSVRYRCSALAQASFFSLFAALAMVAATGLPNDDTPTIGWAIQTTGGDGGACTLSYGITVACGSCGLTSHCISYFDLEKEDSPPSSDSSSSSPADDTKTVKQIKDEWKEEWAAESWLEQCQCATGAALALAALAFLTGGCGGCCCAVGSWSASASKIVVGLCALGTIGAIGFTAVTFAEHRDELLLLPLGLQDGGGDGGGGGDGDGGGGDDGSGGGGDGGGDAGGGNGGGGDDARRLLFELPAFLGGGDDDSPRVLDLAAAFWVFSGGGTVCSLIALFLAACVSEPLYRFEEMIPLTEQQHGGGGGGAPCSELVMR